MARRRAFVLVAILVGAFLVLAAVALPLSSARAHRAVVDELSERLDSTVELQSLDLNLLPMPHATGEGLVVRHQGRQDVPPLISIRRFRVSGSFWGLLRHHIREVTLEGLDLEIPPVRRKSSGARRTTTWEISSPNERLCS